MSFARILFGSTGALIAIMAVAIAAGVRINVTESIPLGLYREIDPSLVRGQLVIACLDPDNRAVAEALERGYMPVGNCPGGVAPVIKHIAAVPGDRINASSDGLILNGQLLDQTRPLLFDPKGRPLHRTYARSYEIQPGQVLLLAQGAGSFDGRYFGPTPVSGIRAAAKPLLTTSPH